MNTRLLIVAAMLLAGSGYVAHATHAEDPVTTKQSLASIPLELGKWRGQESPAMASNVLKVLGVDEYLNRVYLADREPFVSFYVGFYASQRQGDTIHSPLNCLPGAGWRPVVQDRITIPVSDASGSIRSITINQFVIQKGLERQIVLYWYQSHGRVIASEYASKIYMVYDAMRLNRTDAALVRVITPILDVDIATEPAAAARATEFVQRIFPILSGVLPS